MKKNKFTKTKEEENNQTKKPSLSSKLLCSTKKVKNEVKVLLDIPFKNHH